MVAPNGYIILFIFCVALQSRAAQPYKQKKTHSLRNQKVGFKYLTVIEWE